MRYAGAILKLLHETNVVSKLCISVQIPWTNCNKLNNLQSCQYNHLIRILPEEPNRFNDLRSFFPPQTLPKLPDCGDFCGYSPSICCVTVGSGA